MANTKISEISEGGVALGENKFSEGMILGEAMKAGTVVVKSAAGTIVKCTSSERFLGVVKEHEEFDLDTEITIAEEVTVVTDGYVAAFMVQPGATKYAGCRAIAAEEVGAKRGKFEIKTGGVLTAKLLRDVVATDDVAIWKIIG